MASTVYKATVSIFEQDPSVLDEPINLEALNKIVVMAITGFYKASFGWGKCLDYNTVLHSLSHLLGKPVRLPQLFYAMKRLSCNRNSLSRGMGEYARGLAPWRGGALNEREWTCLKFVELVEKNGVITFLLEVCWGFMAPEKVYKAIRADHDSLYTLMYKAGLGRKHSGNPRELIGLHIWGELVYREGIISFNRYDVDPQLERTNKKLIAERRKPCFHSYDWLCCECPVDRNMCHRATRLYPVPTANVPLTLNGLTHYVESDLTDTSASNGGIGESSRREDGVAEPGP